MPNIERKYKWTSAADWLNDKIADAETVSELADITRTCAGMLDNDQIQDSFQSDMEADGFFKFEPIFRLSAPASDLREDFATKQQAQLRAAELLHVYAFQIVEVEGTDSDGNAVVYCYASQQDGDDDQDVSYALRYMEVTE